MPLPSPDNAENQQYRHSRTSALGLASFVLDLGAPRKSATILEVDYGDRGRDMLEMKERRDRNQRMNKMRKGAGECKLLPRVIHLHYHDSLKKVQMAHGINLQLPALAALEKIDQPTRNLNAYAKHPAIRFPDISEISQIQTTAKSQSRLYSIHPNAPLLKPHSRVSSTSTISKSRGMDKSAIDSWRAIIAAKGDRNIDEYSSIVENRSKEQFSKIILEFEKNGIKYSRNSLQNAILRPKDVTKPVEVVSVKSYRRLESPLRTIKLDVPSIKVSTATSATTSTNSTSE